MDAEMAIYRKLMLDAESIGVELLELFIQKKIRKDVAMVAMGVIMVTWEDGGTHNPIETIRKMTRENVQ